MKNITSVLIAVFLIACGPQAIQQESDELPEDQVRLSDAQARGVDLTLSAAKEQSLATKIRLSGSIDVPPQNMVSVSMPLGGYLTSTSLLPGMKVAKGQVIASMEDQLYVQLQQDYLSAKARLEFLTTELERQQALNETKTTSDKSLQLVTLETEQTGVTLQGLAEKLRLIHLDPASVSRETLSRKIKIYSPIDGFVSKVNVNIGKYVMPSDVLFELVNPTDIHLNLTVFERDLANLKVGQTVWAFSNNRPDVRYECEIILISQSLSPEGAAEVHCHFEQYDHTLLPGMYMNAELEIGAAPEWVLPEEAVVSWEGSDYVFLGEGENTFRFIPVDVEGQMGGMVSFVNPEVILGKQIVTKGAYTLLMVLKNEEE